jgi:flagellar assembly factor FliW
METMYETQNYVAPHAQHTHKEAVMSSQQLAKKQELESALPAKTGEEKITTRFGKVVINHDNPLVIAKGMLGMSERKRYCITDFPVEKFSRFKLLQSLGDYDLSFIMMPLPIDNHLIALEDITSSALDLGIQMSDLEMMLVVSVHRDMNKVALSANVRAPLFINTSTRTAEQLVLRNNIYEVRHMMDSKQLMQ